MAVDFVALKHAQQLDHECSPRATGNKRWNMRKASKNTRGKFGRETGESPACLSSREVLSRVIIGHQTRAYQAEQKIWPQSIRHYYSHARWFLWSWLDYVIKELHWTLKANFTRKQSWLWKVETFLGDAKKYWWLPIWSLSSRSFPVF